MRRHKRKFDNCFCCAFDTIFQFTGMVGFPLLRTSCRHNNNVDKISFSTGKLFSVAFIVVVFTGFNIYFLSGTWNSFDKNADVVTWLPAVAVCIIFSRYVQTLVIALWNSKLCETAVTAMDETVKTWKILTNEDLLPSMIIINVHRNSLKIIFLVLTGPSLHIAYASFTRFCSNPLFGLQLSCAIGFYVDLLATFGCEMLFDCLLQIMTQHHCNITHCLEQHLFKPRKSKSSLKNYVAFTTRLQIGTVWIFRTLEKFINPSCVLWLIISTATIIINCYLALTISLDGNEFPPCLITIQIQIFISTILLWRIVAKVNKISHLNKHLLSFLYKYPISKLTSAEADQVEMLIATLNLNRPVMKASDIFVVSTKLLASIAGTTLTYVLVALQFHGTWKRT